MTRLQVFAGLNASTTLGYMTDPEFMCSLVGGCGTEHMAACSVCKEKYTPILSALSNLDFTHDPIIKFLDTCHGDPMIPNWLLSGGSSSPLPRRLLQQQPQTHTHSLLQMLWAQEWMGPWNLADARQRIIEDHGLLEGGGRRLMVMDSAGGTDTSAMPGEI